VQIVNARRVFSASGLPEKPIANVKFANVTAQGLEAGTIEYARDWIMRNVKLRTKDGVPVKLANNERVESPEVVKH
jgi:hypothetical protein